MNCWLRQIGENLYVDHDCRLFTITKGDDYDEFSFVSPNLDEPRVRLEILNINAFLSRNFFTWHGKIKAQSRLNKVIMMSHRA